MTATPSVSFNPGSATPFIGTTAQVTLSFSNTGSNAGFAPFMVVHLPMGADGNDGATLSSATYLGSAVPTTILTIGGGGTAINPITGQTISGTPGQQVAVLTLPFGSFSPGQTAADVVLNLAVSNFADNNTPLSLQASGGFAFGNDPLNNPGVDPVVTGAPAAATITPQLATLTKTYLGPEQETATGPSWTREWVVEGNIAPGQQVTNYTITDTLPNGVVINSAFTAALSTNLPASISTAAGPGGTTIITAVFTGTLTGGVDVPRLNIPFWVNQAGTGGGPVLGPTTGSFTPLTNSANWSATWDPIDPADPAGPVSGAAPVTNIIEAQSIAIQKGVAVVGGGLGVPGVTLEYTLNTQISDYFALADLTVIDTLGDGQTFLAGFTPTISFLENGVATGPVALLLSEYTVAPKNGAGQTVITIDMDEAALRLGYGATLEGQGGAAPNPTSALITFRATVDQTWTGPVPGDPRVDQGDSLNNGVIQDGTINGNTVVDDSGTTVALPTNLVAKGISHVNGVAVLPGPLVIQSGDDVTYHLRLDMPLTNSHSVTIHDFLPLPVFDATDPDANGAANLITWVAGPPSAVAPLVNTAKLGPLTTTPLPLIGMPIITQAAGSNSVTFDFGSIVDAPSFASSTIDLYFTVRVRDQAFGDGLLLTNQVTSNEANSQNAPFQANAIVQFNLGEPILNITKGIVSTNGAGSFSAAVGPVAFAAPGVVGPAFAGTINTTNLAATPINANLNNADGGDLVKFAIVIDNAGSAPRGAFDVLIRDLMPAGYGPASNIRVTDGAGNLKGFTLVGGGLFDPAGGLLLDDAPNQGAIGVNHLTDGSDIIVITYDAQVVDTIATGSVLTNVATVANYAALEAGVNRTPTDGRPDSDPATVNVEAPSSAKSLQSSSAAHTSGNNLAIGETGTWLVTVTIPEGINGNLVIRDIMPGGVGGTGRVLELLSVGGVTAGASLSGPGLAAGLAAPVISNSNLDPYNDTLTFTLGTVTNTPDGLENSADQISFLVTGRVVNIGANTGNSTGANRAQVQVDDPNNPGSTITHTINSNLRIVEPAIDLQKTVSDDTPVAGQVVTYTLVLTNTASGAGAAAAFDALITDTLAAIAPNVVLNVGSVAAVNSGGFATNILTGNTVGDTGIQVASDRLNPGQTLTVTFDATVVATVPSGGVFTNTANASFTTLPGADPNERSYTDSDTATVTLPRPQTTKTLVASSDPNTSGNDLTIGEVATFRIAVDIPDGTNNNVTITDILPDLTGGAQGRLLYIPGSVSVISVGANLTGVPPIPTVTEQDNNANGTNETLILGFGNIINAPADLLTNAADRITIEFQARVVDIAQNQSGDVLTNQAFATANGLTGNTSSASVDVIAPVLNVTKATPFTTGDAGDVMTFTVTIEHTGASTAIAYDVTLADLLPTGLLPVGVPTASVGAASFAGNQLNFSLAQYALGQPAITITYQARLADSVFNGQSITNTANLGWNSQPGGSGRAGTDSAQDTVGAVILDTLDKTQVATSLPATLGNDLAIGETVTYRLTATLDEGSQNLTLSDALPGGLTYLSSSVVSLGNITGSALLVGAAGAFNGGTNTVSFAFGTIVNPGDNLENAGDQVVVEIVARVNSTATVGGTLTDTGTLTATTPGGTPMPTLTDTHVNTVVGPMLDVTKNTPFTVGDAGDVATYTLTIAHLPGSTADAYNVLLSDLMPAGLTLVGVPTTTAGTLTTPGGNIQLNLAQYALGAAPITITYQARLADNVVDGLTIPNTANLSWSSAPANGAPGSDSASDSIAVDINDSLDKSVIATSFPLTPGLNVGIGEIITYRLTATLGEGAQNLLLTDVMPSGLIYLSSSVISLGNITGSALGVGAAGSFNGGTNTVSFNFGNIINPGDNLLDAGDRITVEVLARVAPGVITGDLLTNTGTLTPTIGSNPFGLPPGTPMPPATDTETLTVVPVSAITGAVGLNQLFFCCGTEASAVFEGVTVNLLDLAGNVISSTVTDANGGYSLPASIGGIYQVQFVLPSGLVFAPLGSPGLAGLVNDANPTTGITAPITVTPLPVAGVDAGVTYWPKVGLTGNLPQTLPDGGGSYNFDMPGAYAVGGVGGYNLNGNGGQPYFVGGTGFNILHGGNGNGSILVGGPAGNIFEGTPGADIILFCCGGGVGQGLGGNGQALGSGAPLFNGNACFNFDLMVGGNNNDTIEGNSGNVVAIGNGGNDEIHAQGLIIAGPNTGTMTDLGGGNFGNVSVGDIVKIANGATRVVYQLGDGVQRIENFNPGRGDTIEIFGYGAPTAVGMVNGSGVLYFGPNAALIINGWQPQNGPLSGINYYAALTQAPGAFGRFNPLPPVVLPATQTSFHGSQGDDIAIGGPIGTTFRGNGGEDLLIGGNADDIFWGGAQNDSFFGGGGNDQFNLGPGSDFASGCGGTDVAILNLNQAQATIINNADGTRSVITPTGLHLLDGVEYIRFNDALVNISGVPQPPLLLGTAGADGFAVNDAGTVILDGVNGDNDQAFVSVNGWTVAPNVEIARLIGQATSITGNATGTQLVANALLASTMVSGGGATVFWGGAGADTMIGGMADDVFRPGNAAAVMTGGAGNDHYVITNAAQVVNELPGGGIDTAWVNVNGWTMAANVEIGRLQGTANMLTGNNTGGDLVANPLLLSMIVGGSMATTFWGGAGADIFIGGAGDDIFRSGPGAAQMYGADGNDQYVINNVAQYVGEIVGMGTDTAWVNVDGWTLAMHVEVGRLAGAATQLAGGHFANQLVANPGLGSTLTAGTGTTAMWGGAAADTMVVSASNQQIYLYGGADVVRVTATPWGIDEVADFSGTWGDGDKLDFQGSGITGLGMLTITDFGDKTLVAAGASQLILYGVGSLTNVLTAGDFVF